MCILTAFPCQCLAPKDGRQREGNIVESKGISEMGWSVF